MRIVFSIIFITVGVLTFSVAFAKEFQPDDNNLNAVLHRLYTEIKCPPKYHFNKEEFPYAYCIESVYYEKQSDTIVFNYNLHSNYREILDSAVSVNIKHDFRQVVKLIGYDLGIAAFDKTNKTFGVLDSFRASNMGADNYKSDSLWRRFIRRKSVIHVVLVDENKQWHQAASNLTGEFFYTKNKRPLSLMKLIESDVY